MQLSFLFLNDPSLFDTFVPHSSSTPQINASPKLHLLTDELGLYIGKYTNPLDTVGSAVTFWKSSKVIYHPTSLGV